MEEPASWKGHSFTLLVFGGIVVLCSIFFILGMLVGRNQGQRIAESAAVEDPAGKAAAAPTETSQLGFVADIVAEKPDMSLEPPPPPPDPTSAVPESLPVPDPADNKKIFLQVIAMEDSREADRVLKRLQSEKFRALKLPPVPGEKEALYRVQVGPFDSIADAEIAKKELQTLGFEGVFRK